jgi:hypothetical protein
MLYKLDYKYALRICNIFCFSTAAVVTRTRLNITFYTYIACLSFWNWTKRYGVPRHFSARKFPNYSRAKTDRPISERLSFLNYCLWHLMLTYLFSSISLCRWYADMLKHFHLSLMMTCSSIFIYNFCIDML